MRTERQPLAVTKTKHEISLLGPLFISFFVGLTTFGCLSFAKLNAIQYITDTPKCPGCSIMPIHSPTSTKRDVILAAALSGSKRVDYFVRTLRATGCRARIILFINESQPLTEGFTSIVQCCGVEVVYVNHDSYALTEVPKMSRYYFEQQWLQKHIKEVDRVIHSDTFDVIFQSDPFIPQISRHKLYFTFEPVILKESFWTNKWMDQCYGIDIIRKYSNEYISCSGVTAGGSKLYLEYLNILLNTPKWKTCYGHSLDQAHHNYLLFTGGFKDIPIEKFGCDSPYLTMHFCCKREKCHLDNGVMFGPGDKPPVLIHQYNRWKNLTEQNKVVCPIDKVPNTEKTLIKIEKLPYLQGDLPKEIVSL